MVLLKNVRQLETAERQQPSKCTNFVFFTPKMYKFWVFYHQSVRILFFLPPKCTNFGFFTTKVYKFWVFYHQSVRIFFFQRKCTNIGASRDVPDVPRRTSVVCGTVQNTIRYDCASMWFFLFVYSSASWKWPDVIYEFVHHFFQIFHHVFQRFLTFWS